MLLEIINSENLKLLGEIIFKTLLCILLVGWIGYNREKKGMVVGIRTHVLVGLAGLLIQLTSLEYYRINGGNNDVFRLAGQYVSGIGFLGAGTILKDKRSVKGLTTAASIFLVACIGLAVGAGVYASAIIITLTAYVFLIDLFKIRRLVTINRNSYVFFNVEIEGIKTFAIDKIKDTIKNLGIDILTIEAKKIEYNKFKIKLKLVIDDELDINEILAEVISIEEVSKAEVI